MKKAILFFNFFLRKYSIFIVLVIMLVAGTLLSENFLTTRNLANVSRQISVTTILAFGQTLLIIAGLIDLSSAAVLAASGLLSVYIYTQTGSFLIAIPIGISFGILCNFINSIFVHFFKVPAFIITLAMMMFARGLALLFTKGQSIYNIGDFSFIGQGSIFFVPVPIILMLTIWLVTWFILNHTKLGRSLYAIGGNEEAAIFSGIKVGYSKIVVYLINGVFVGIAGIIFMSRVNAGLPNGAIGAEFEALTAAIIGGTSFSGGVGTATGTLVGAFIVGILNNIMNLTGVDSYLQQVVRGSVIALAVVYDIQTKNKK